MSHDLSTERGLNAFLENFMVHLTSTFRAAGAIQLGVAAIVTRHQGRRLPSPKVILFFPNLDAPVDKGFLSRTYLRAIDEHKAVGAFTFGQATSVLVEDPVEIEAWRGNSLARHPRCYETVSLKLEHTIFGVRLWCARVEDGKLGPFELQTDHDSECSQGGFLDQLRTHPSTA